MEKRLKTLRAVLGLTQEEFALRIGAVRNTVTGYETGRRVPSNQTVAMICREFRVRREWLLEGKGEMFDRSSEATLEQLAREQALTPAETAIIARFLELSPSVRSALLGFILKVAADINSGALGSVNLGQPAPSGPSYPETPEDLHAALDRQLSEEKEAADGSGALPSTESGTA